MPFSVIFVIVLTVVYFVHTISLYRKVHEIKQVVVGHRESGTLFERTRDMKARSVNHR